MIDFEWKGSDRQDVKEIDENTKIFIRNNEGPLEETPQINCKEGMGTLEVRLERSSTRVERFSQKEWSD